MWAGKGQSKATLQEFFTALGPDRCAAITHVSADSAKYIADVVATNCPDAVQVADPFHVVPLREFGNAAASGAPFS